MKRSAKFYLSFIFMILFSVASVFAQDWYVCLGSFKTQYYADSMMDALNEAGYDVCYSEEDTSLGHMYRVFLNEPCATAKEAKAVRNRILFELPIIEHTEGNLWICQTVPLVIRNADVNEKVVLETNSEIPLSKNKPYSVLVHTYKEELQAEKGKKKLKEKNIDSFIVKTFDEKTSFTFDLHSGAFETEEETYDYQEKLETLGIGNTKISNYNTILDRLNKYDEVVQNQKITYETGSDNLSDLFNKYLISAVNEFPANNNYQIEKLCVYNIDENHDLDFTYNDYDSFSDIIGFYWINNIIDDISKAHAVIYAKYKDELFGKSAEIFLLKGEPECVSNEIPSLQQEELETATLACGKIKYCIQENSDSASIQGITENRDTYIQCTFDDAAANEISELLNSFSKDNLLSYNQIKKNLCIIPNQDSENSNRFRCFTFSQVKQNYADLRNNINWAEEMVGHYLSAIYLKQNTDNISIGVFDLDYAYNAKKNQSYYVDSRSDISSINHPVEFLADDAWLWNNEFTFSQKSYLVAIDVHTFNGNEKSFTNIGEQLLIWNK